MKVKVAIVTTHTSTIDIGDIPIRLVQSLLENNDGTFDGNYGLGDIASRDEVYVTESVTVEKVA